MIAVATHAHVHSVSGGDATSAPIDTTGASAVVVFVASLASASPAASVSDNKSNVWTPLTKYSSADVAGKFFYCIGGTFGTGHTFTIGNGGSSQPSAVVLVLTGSGAFDVATGDWSNGTSHAPGSVSPAKNGSIIITGVGTAGAGMSVDSGFTLVDSVDFASQPYVGVGLGCLIQTTKAPVNPTWSITSGSEVTVAAMVLSPPPTPPTAPSNLALASVISTAATIQWDASTGEDNYTVEYDTVSSFDAAPVSLVVTTSPLKISQLIPQTQYFFRVKASNADGDSDWAFDGGHGHQYVSVTTPRLVLASAVHNFSKVAAAFLASKTERVLFLNSSDSNEEHSGYGWSYGVPGAMLSTFGLWGQNSVAFQGPDTNGNFSDAEDALAPAFYHQFAGSVGAGDSSNNLYANRINYSYRSTTTASGTPHDFSGLPFVFGGANLPLADALTVTFDYATGMGGSTSDFITTWRSNLGSPGAVGTTHYSCGSGSQGMVNASVNIPAAGGRTTFEFYLGSPSNWGGDVGVTGPFFSTRAVIQRTNQLIGFMYQTMIRYGGAGLALWLSDAMQSSADGAYGYMIKFLASLCQGSSTRIVFGINTGLHDQDGDNLTNFPANLQAVMDKCSAYAAAAGLSAGNVYFLLWPAHVTSNPDNAGLISIRQLCRDLSDGNPRTCAFDFELAGMRYDDMVANGYYFIGGAGVESVHLSDPSTNVPSGYDYAAGLLMASLQDALTAAGGDDFGGFGFGFEL